MTTSALSKATGGSWPLRHGGALEALNDAGQWVLDTLREWLQRSRDRHQLAGLDQRCCATSRSPLGADSSE